MTERVLRAETDFLKAQELLIIDAAGMRISESGKRLLEEMEPYIKDVWFIGAGGADPQAISA